jgi:hypothetical protein
MRLSLWNSRSLQNCNHWQAKFFGTTATRALLAAALGVGLAFSVAAQGKEQPGEMVEMKSLPASVQQTINQKAAGGEIVQIKREDDVNGKWNYEVSSERMGKSGASRWIRAGSS